VVLGDIDTVEKPHECKEFEINQIKGLNDCKAFASRCLSYPGFVFLRFGSDFFLLLIYVLLQLLLPFRIIISLLSYFNSSYSTAPSSFPFEYQLQWKLSRHKLPDYLSSNSASSHPHTFKMHNIVILGGNFSGVSTAHYLLRHVLPLLNSNTDKPSYKVTLVSPSDHTFFKVGAPRALMGTKKTELLAPFHSLTEAFSSYPASTFTFILGSAIALDSATQTITVKTEKEETVHYDSLVIATGTTSNSPLWTLHSTFAETESAFEDLNFRLSTAKTILIAGGGPAGVETTGEIGYKYKGQGKSITLLSGADALLSYLKHSTVSRIAESQLNGMGVKTVHKLRVVSSTAVGGGKTEVVLSDGSKQVVDLYIDATGGTPNSSFLPPSWLDSRKKVVTESTTLRATAAGANIYSIGDVASFSKGNVPDAMWAVNALGYSIYEDLSKGGKGLKEKRYKQIQASMGVVPIGPKGGVGVLFGWRVPSWFVWLIKARGFMMENAPALATGASVLKA
jgi:apoptosis-inducing factor 2